MADTSSIANLIDCVRKLTPEQLLQLGVAPVDNLKNTYEREIAPHLPYVYEVTSAQEFNQYHSTFNNRAVSMNFISGVKKNSTVSVILMHQLEAIESIKYTYPTGGIYCKVDKCNCDLPACVIDKRTRRDHCIINVTNKDSLNTMSKSYFLDDWLKNPIYKDYDEMFGHYEPLNGHEDVANLRVVNKGS